MSGELVAKAAFEFLESEFDFRLASFRYEAAHFGNFIARYERDAVVISVTRDRGQVFIDFTGADGVERDKEDLLEGFGIHRSRHPIVSGLWTGYDLESQVGELKRYLPQLLAAVQVPTRA